MNDFSRIVCICVIPFFTFFSFLYGGNNEESQLQDSEKWSYCCCTNSYIDLLNKIKQIGHARLADESFSTEKFEPLLQENIKKIKKIPLIIQITKENLENNLFSCKTIRLSFKKYYDPQKENNLFGREIKILLSQQLTLLGNTLYSSPNRSIDFEAYIKINGKFFIVTNQTLNEIAYAINNAEIGIIADVFSSIKGYGIKLTHNKYEQEQFIELIDPIGLLSEAGLHRVQGTNIIAKVIIGNHIEIPLDKRNGNILYDSNGNVIELTTDPNLGNNYPLNVPFTLDYLPYDYCETLNSSIKNIKLLGSEVVPNMNLYNINFSTQSSTQRALDVIQKAIQDAQKIASKYVISNF